MNKKHIVIIAMPDCLSTDLVAPSDVFSVANDILAKQYGQSEKTSSYKITFASATQDLELKTDNGLVIRCQTSIYDLHGPIDTLIVAGFSSHVPWNSYPDLSHWLKSKAADIRRIASVCVGAFALAEAGLLEGKKATTHWNACKELQNSYSKIEVLHDAIFVKDGSTYTSAGVSCGVDLALALVEEDFGQRISLKIAQLFVLYLKRSGGQSQFSFLLQQQFSDKEPISILQEWITNNLHKELKTAILAEKVAMSERNFVRVFQSEVGVTPAKYVEKMRIEYAKQLLSETNLTLDKIAMKCGFTNKDIMGRAFKRNLKITPNYYRLHFELS
ncbi:helix-turn-helix domain-containing protein [Xenorhabdus sp. 12]|uniref:Helix-turn-helix domain-containing protein n=1 Tax=Xenorhabdus santafensis TaxID=2582833 RepID=A0ABU4SB58_9GAMM|nr:helix-turn-helix domain-containing protein [Xenorhabdus sp. 12]MDX7988027.1 helix-turn-helix domain-containing protein [Xenorhabdus sp. 12]